MTFREVVAMAWLTSGRGEKNRPRREPDLAPFLSYPSLNDVRQMLHTLHASLSPLQSSPCAMPKVQSGDWVVPWKND